jgi:hypothetical protein
MSPGRRRHLDAGLLERRDLLGGRALAARDDRARVAHALARGGRAAGDEPATGFFMLALIHAAARSSAVPPISPIMITPSVSGSSLKSFEHVDEVECRRSDRRRCPRTSTGRCRARELPDGLVGERARARQHADVALLVDVARHDADLALVRRDDAGAVRADERALWVSIEAAHAQHVEDGDALGDADDELDSRRRSASMIASAAPGGRHEDARDSAPVCFTASLDGVEDRAPCLRTLAARPGVTPATTWVP